MKPVVRVCVAPSTAAEIIDDRDTVYVLAKEPA
jgi:hypothetical protein